MTDRLCADCEQKPAKDNSEFCVTCHHWNVTLHTGGVEQGRWSNGSRWFKPTCSRGCEVMIGVLGEHAGEHTAAEFADRHAAEANKLIPDPTEGATP